MEWKVAYFRYSSVFREFRILFFFRKLSFHFSFDSLSDQSIVPIGVRLEMSNPFDEFATEAIPVSTSHYTAATVAHSNGMHNFLLFALARAFLRETLLIINYIAFFV